MTSDPADGDVSTWRAEWARASRMLGDRTAARWMCETAAGAFGDEFQAVLDERPAARAIAHLDAMLERAVAGEPLQYVLGRWAFRRLDLLVDRRVLIPRPETELVAELAIGLAASCGPPRTVADLGTGSGAIGLALADELPIEGTTVWITDVDADALDVASANLAGLGRAAANVRLGRGSWTDALPADSHFDVIVSNPPYVAIGSPDVERSVVAWEPASALFAGPDGLDAIRRLVNDAFDRLRPGGWLVLEIGADQRGAALALLGERGFTDAEVLPDLAGRDRVALGRRPATLFHDGDLHVRHLLNQPDDLALMLRWLRTPEVLEWFEGRDQDHDLDDVRARYGPGGEHEREGTISTIFEVAGRPVGYLQLYELGRWAGDFGLDDGSGIWSLDLFVGEPELHGGGLGRRVVRAAAEYLLAERAARDVVIMPYPENARAVAAYRAAGFVEDAIVHEHEVHEGRMRDGLRMVYRPG